MAVLLVRVGLVVAAAAGRAGRRGCAGAVRQPGVDAAVAPRGVRVLE